MPLRLNIATDRSASAWRSTGRAVSVAIAIAAASSIVVIQTGATSSFAEEAKSSTETALNPFGDAWSLAKPNPSAALTGTAGCYRKPAPGMTFAFTEQEMDYQRARATPLVLETCAIILETDPPVVNDEPGGDTAALKARVAQFKEANPSEKYLGYFDFSKWEQVPIGYKAIRKGHPDWFVYRQGTSKDDLDNRLKPKHGGGFVMDVTNSEYQDYIAQKIADGLLYYGMDGFLADNIRAAPWVSEEDESSVPDEIRAGWADGEIAILEKVKTLIGAEKLLLANVNRNETEAFAADVIAVVDGLMVEDGFSPISRALDPSKGRLAGTLRRYDLAAAAGKYIIVTASTFVDGSTQDSTSSAKEHAYARYYLAAHLIFMQGKVFLHYNPPSAVGRQYGSEAFFRDWNINVGAPTGSYREIAKSVFQRDFENAIVYLNSSDAPFAIEAPAGFSLSPEGETVSEFTLEPKSGFLLSSPAAFQ